jgi:hypothetical protein
LQTRITEHGPPQIAASRANPSPAHKPIDHADSKPYEPIVTPVPEPSPVVGSGDTPTLPSQPGACSTGLLTAIVNFVRRQGGVVERLLALDVPGTVATEVDAVRRLIRELFGLDCGRDEIEVQVRRVGATAG